tara:strand:- start:2675 stop:3781 length:1107 start_codon:yes stop_codon:yes gene_type:complete
LIQVFKPKLSISDVLSVLINLFKNNISGTSPVVGEFEHKLANIFGREHVTALSNGSVALDVAFQLIDLQEDDEVILPSFTIVSCLSAVIRSKAKPVFCDVKPDSWNMSLEQVVEKVTKKTKAVLMVHIYGLPSEAKEIAKFCKSRGIILIEDAAEAHGQKENGELCGSFGDISTLSFYANKHITTGEGGALLTNNHEYDKNAKQMRNLDFSNEQRFNSKNLYWNYRMSGLQAALGISQIKNLNKTIKNKKKQGAYYQQLFADYGEIVQTPLKSINLSENHYWVFGILLKKENMRDVLMEELRSKGIETRPFFWPLHLQDALPEKYKPEENSLPTSEQLGSDGLYIPIGPHIKRKHQEFIVKSILEILY